MFNYPVTDNIAPGYSDVIKRPMNFNEIKHKIYNNLYLSLSEFKDDLDLIWNNAVIYNSSQTVYYKEAQKMRAYTEKLFNGKKLIKILETVNNTQTWKLTKHAPQFCTQEQKIDELLQLSRQLKNAETMRILESVKIAGQKARNSNNISKPKTLRALPSFSDIPLNYTHEQCRQLIETYGNVTGAVFAMSMCKFVMRNHNGIRSMIHALLNNSLDNKHSRFIRSLKREQHKKSGTKIQLIKDILYVLEKAYNEAHITEAHYLCIYNDNLVSVDKLIDDVAIKTLKIIELKMTEGNKEEEEKLGYPYFSKILGRELASELKKIMLTVRE
ncbi:hypothetical protein MXB_1328 [Myxobolus squamalis]|nr:hypothetical protein MXB_1328 [Myxobolus squamalis]